MIELTTKQRIDAASKRLQSVSDWVYTCAHSCYETEDDFKQLTPFISLALYANLEFIAMLIGEDIDIDYECDMSSINDDKELIKARLEYLLKETACGNIGRIKHGRNLIMFKFNHSFSPTRVNLTFKYK